MQKFSLDGLLLAANDLRDRHPNLQIIKIIPTVYGIIFETEREIYRWSYVSGGWRIKSKNS